MDLFSLAEGWSGGALGELVGAAGTVEAALGLPSPAGPGSGGGKGGRAGSNAAGSAGGSAVWELDAAEGWSVEAAIGSRSDSLEEGWEVQEGDGWLGGEEEEVEEEE